MDRLDPRRHRHRSAGSLPRYPARQAAGADGRCRGGVVVARTEAAQAGARRAAAAKAQLVKLGVPAARVSTVSYGKERPAITGSNAAAWAENRRAVTVLIDKK